MRVCPRPNRVAAAHDALRPPVARTDPHVRFPNGPCRRTIVDLTTRLMTTGLLLALAAGGPALLLPVCGAAVLVCVRAVLRRA